MDVVGTSSFTIANYNYDLQEYDTLETGQNRDPPLVFNTLE